MSFSLPSSKEFHGVTLSPSLVVSCVDPSLESDDDEGEAVVPLASPRRSPAVRASRQDVDNEDDPSKPAPPAKEVVAMLKDSKTKNQFLRYLQIESERNLVEIVTVFELVILIQTQPSRELRKMMAVRMIEMYMLPGAKKKVIFDWDAVKTPILDKYRNDDEFLSQEGFFDPLFDECCRTLGASLMMFLNNKEAKQLERTASKGSKGSFGSFRSGSYASLLTRHGSKDSMVGNSPRSINPHGSKESLGSPKGGINADLSRMGSKEYLISPRGLAPPVTRQGSKVDLYAPSPTTPRGINRQGSKADLYTQMPSTPKRDISRQGSKATLPSRGGSMEFKVDEHVDDDDEEEEEDKESQEQRISQEEEKKPKKKTDEEPRVRTGSWSNFSILKRSTGSFTGAPNSPRSNSPFMPILRLFSGKKLVT